VDIGKNEKYQKKKLKINAIKINILVEIAPLFAA
jgi:hypothetical protein